MSVAGTTVRIREENRSVRTFRIRTPPTPAISRKRTASSPRLSRWVRFVTLTCPLRNRRSLQNLSVDVPDASYLTPMAPPPPLQLTGITPSGQASPHVGNHVGSPQSAYLVNHVKWVAPSPPRVHPTS